jgi:hypothetical protein
MHNYYLYDFKLHDPVVDALAEIGGKAKTRLLSILLAPLKIVYFIFYGKYFSRFGYLMI